MEKALGMFVVLLVALSMTGVAVAHWSENVQIQGIVHMGEFIVGWENRWTCLDSDDGGLPEKDVGEVHCEVAGPETGVHTEKTVYNTLLVRIENAYGEYWARCWGWLKNAGTIPAHIVEYKITPGPGLEVSENCYDWRGPPYMTGWRLDNADTHLPVMVVKLVKNWPAKESLICTQIDPCNEQEARLWIRILQEGAEECHHYSFTMEVIAVQWNMAWEWGFDHYPEIDKGD